MIKTKDAHHPTPKNKEIKTKYFSPQKRLDFYYIVG
jgi:hypothetical protein